VRGVRSGGIIIIIIPCAYRVRGMRTPRRRPTAASRVYNTRYFGRWLTRRSRVRRGRDAAAEGRARGGIHGD